MFWEYDTRIARRWNLDPKPQISISDYAVFGNSPIINIDILGDIVEHASNRDKLNTIWGRITNKNFRQNYRRLKGSDETFVFKGTKSNMDSNDFGPSERGETTYDGDKITLNYKYGKQHGLLGTRRLSTMFHEAVHGTQLLDGKFGFAKNGSIWEAQNLDATDEFEAVGSGTYSSVTKDYIKDWKVAGKYKRRYGFVPKPTNASLWKNGTIDSRKEMIQKSYGLTVGISKVNANDVKVKNETNFFMPYNKTSPNPSGATIEYTDKQVPIPIPIHNEDNYKWDLIDTPKPWEKEKN